MDIEKLPLSKCTGCASCFNICPKDAIHLLSDKKGFYIPKIDHNLCVNCGLCIDSCPVINIKLDQKEYPEVLACWSKDDVIRKNCTSGGISHIVAKFIIKNGGVVYGAVINDSYKVVHTRIDKLNDLAKMQGSKYVQSYIGNTFRQVLRDLNNDCLVLYTGTPCQIAGLKNYLKKDYNNLYTIDIICHGAPSPLIFKKYIENIFLKYSTHGQIVDIKFRYKSPTWTNFSMKISFADGFVYVNDMYNDPYLRSFLENYITRECCHDCKFTNIKRVGDITLADFWSYISETYKNRNTEKGMNLLLINSKNGKRLINEIKDEIEIVCKNIQDALRSNKCLYKSYSANKKAEQYWNMFYQSENIDLFFNSFFNYKQKISVKYKASVFYMNHAYLVPKKLRSKINTIIDEKRRVDK